MDWKSILQRQSEWTKSAASDYRMSVEEALMLYNDAPLHQLMDAAHQRRVAMHGPSDVTYLVDRNINYTNVCTINCQFCSFYRPPGHDETYTQSFEEISGRISALEEIGGVRILMQGGVNPALPFEWYEELLNHIRTNHPTIAIDCFSPIEIEGIAEVSNLSTLEVLTRLKASGMHGLPGGGAEMLVDDVRKDVSPKKGLPANWLRVMEEAQSLHLTTSATNVIGFGESNEQRVEHMRRIRNLQDASLSQHGIAFTSFIAWPVQLESNSFGRRNRGSNRVTLGAGSSEYLRHVAVSRLFLDSIPSIQSSWPTMGIKTAQMALFGGANDVGSTMMEENVVSASGTTKFSASEKELQYVIKRAGFNPVRRDSNYVHLETPILDTSEKIPSPIPVQG